MEEKLGQSTAVLFKYEKLILAEEETTSARVSRGFFIV